MGAMSRRVFALQVSILFVLPSFGVGKCLCCRGDQSTAEEGFCKWWSAKHAKVEALGIDVIGSDASEESRRLFIAYFRTHARLEDPIMWDLFRECSAFNATVHEPLLHVNEQEEDEIRQGLNVLAAQIDGQGIKFNEQWSVSPSPSDGLAQTGVSSTTNLSSLRGVVGDWSSLRAKVAAHTANEERILKDSGLLEVCEDHLDRRWTEVMENTHQDAQILYEEFRNMELSLVQILTFVRGMVADWPSFPELRLRTAMRMRQVRHHMPEMVESNNGADILQQFSFGVLKEYIRWIELERAEGLALNVWDELRLHFGLLPSLLIAQRHTFAQCAILLTAVPLLALSNRALAKSSGR